jgi:hypothetical protein
LELAKHVLKFVENNPGFKRKAILSLLNQEPVCTVPLAQVKRFSNNSLKPGYFGILAFFKTGCLTHKTNII